MQPRMCYDGAAWEKSEEIADTWVTLFFDPSISRPIGDFVIQHHKLDDAVQFELLEKGAFNISLQMKYKVGSAVIRFPIPGATMFPEEKTRYEVATVRYIKDQTSIPVPFIYHWGSKKDCPLEVGPFMIMDYIEHDSSMYDVFNYPECPYAERGRLDPNIDEDILEAAYGEMAGVLLKLAKTSLPRIGSVTQMDDFTWEVANRPLPMTVNELVQLASLPQSCLPTTPFDSASLYFESLANLLMAHLKNQRNDAIQSADDCRRKFVARCLFLKLARERKLNKRWDIYDQGPFNLWGDDFRPANVLINKEKNIVGIVDFEFTYAAPVEFSFAPPWWLLLKRPEYWPDGLEDWTKLFDRRLQTFLKAMVQCEDDAIEKGRLSEKDRLSGPMRESWDSGDFWILYAVLRNFAFDLVYWHKIDHRFFGPSDNVEDAWRQRLDLLDDTEKEEMERLVAQKLEKRETRVLAWDPDPYTLSHIDIAKTMAAKGNGQTEGKEGDEDSKEKPNDPDTQQICEGVARLSTSVPLSG
ncbi:hypothetical protein FE257_011118 [Aspergillus nanangensis]|uniref:Aminoglycoside phosphotransferase domain-containing protein n=1 Tax=Aspergillus nanangensis TaxID=2582783 RepID=A0AAD4CHT8_ASPNN|nr:hypothetical protein FE257_011118 [Aspergillus nanangensis]